MSVDTNRDKRIERGVDRVTQAVMDRIWALQHDTGAKARLGRTDGSQAYDLILGGLPVGSPEVDVAVAETILPLWGYHERGSKDAHRPSQMSVFEVIDYQLGVTPSRAATLKNSLVTAADSEAFARALATVVRMARVRSVSLDYEALTRATYYAQRRQSMGQAARILARVGRRKA